MEIQIDAAIVGLESSLVPRGTIQAFRSLCKFLLEEDRQILAFARGEETELVVKALNFLGMNPSIILLDRKDILFSSDVLAIYTGNFSVYHSEKDGDVMSLTSSYRESAITMDYAKSWRPQRIIVLDDTYTFRQMPYEPLQKP